MTCRCTLLIILLFAGISSFGQVDSAFLEVEKAMQKEFDDFARQNQKEFDQYVTEIDKEFSDYLRQNWEEFRLFAGIKPDTTPKPVKLPKFDPAISKIKPGEVPKEIKIQPAKETLSPVLQPLPNLPVVIRSEPEEPVVQPKGIPLDFYGTRIEIDFDPSLNGSLPQEIHNTTIADFWDRVNKTDYMSLIRLLADIRTKLNLNDWGYYLLVKKTADLINPYTNYSRLLTWFLLTKSGYRTRVAYAENQIALMFPSSNTIYGLRYFLIDQVKFYAPDFALNQIYTYEKDFPGASKVFDMNLYHALNIGDQSAERSFQLSFKGREYSFSIRYNMNAISFYKDFPLCELGIFFDAAVTPGTKESILDAIKPKLDGLSIPDAVDFLLNFVQNGFPYKTDQDQFNGEEKFFFPEEDFYYPYSDCDDRAVLFAYLVKELLGLKVVGVAYPGHVATAVKFPGEEAGDFIMHKGEKYIIADPTYIDAPFGLTMPGMVNAKAEIIELSNEQSIDDLQASVWEKAETGGGLKGDNRQNLCLDPEGNIYVTGYFHQKADFGGTILTSDNGRNDAFLAKYNATGKPVWAIKGASEGNGMGYHVTIDQPGNIYVCGIFEKSISFGGIMTMGGSGNSIFVAKFNGDGHLVWLNRVKLDSAESGVDYIFASSFTPTGELLETKQFPPDVNFSGYGLSFDKQNNIYFTGTYGGTAGLKIDRIALNSMTEFNVITALKEEIDKQIETNCEKTISGLFGAFNLMKMGNVMISGKEIQQAFDKYNPGFKTLAPTVFNKIGKLRLIKNEEGIVTVQTEEEKPVIIDKLKITNNTRLKVTSLPTGDTRVDILNGIKVGKAFIWFGLNYVRLFRTNGNVLFDYDSDHSQITLNMKKDILM